MFHLLPLPWHLARGSVLQKRAAGTEEPVYLAVLPPLPTWRFMVLINQLKLYLQPTYTPLKCPNMVISTGRKEQLPQTLNPKP